MLDFADYPHIFPPPGFIPVNRIGSIPLAGGFVGNVATIDIPTQYEGWLNQAGIALSDYADTTFSLTQSGIAVRDYNSLNAPLGAPETPAQIFLQLFASQPFALFVDNSAGGPIAIRWRLFGWYFRPR